MKKIVIPQQKMGYYFLVVTSGDYTCKLEKLGREISLEPNSLWIFLSSMKNLQVLKTDMGTAKLSIQPRALPLVKEFNITSLSSNYYLSLTTH